MPVYSLTSRYDYLDPCLDDYTSWYVYNQQGITDPGSCTQFLRLAIDGRLFLLNLLHEEIVSLRQSHTNPTDLDKALFKFTQEYVFNTNTIVDPTQLLKFLKQSTDDTLHLLHLMRDELREVQQKGRQESLLWLPENFR